MAKINICKPSYEIWELPEKPEEFIAKVARVCYRSEGSGPEADRRLLKSLVDNGHLAMIEFQSATVVARCDRGIANELVRHRIASYAQESQRYVNYDKRGYDFVIPEGTPEPRAELMVKVFQLAADAYEQLIDEGAKPEEACYVLPRSSMTRIVMRYNLREWRHVFSLRCDRHAHPMMRSLMGEVLSEFKRRVPYVYDDLDVQ